MADPVLDPESNERNKVVAFLVALDAFTDDARDWRDFVRAAGLGRFVPGINWAGPPAAVAGNLADVLSSHCFLMESPTYHALARWLVYCLEYPLVGVDNATLLATLEVRHGLVRDPAYIEDLRDTYKILGAPPLPCTLKPMRKDGQGLEQTLSDRTLAH